MQVALDSSIVIHHFRTKKGLLPILIEQMQQEKIEIILSSLVLFELWRGTSMKSKKITDDMETFLSDFPVISVNATIAKSAGELERGRFIHGNDAIIAATCLEHHAQLATLNPKDVARVPGLKIWKQQ